MQHNNHDDVAHKRTNTCVACDSSFRTDTVSSFSDYDTLFFLQIENEKFQVNASVFFFVVAILTQSAICWIVKLTGSTNWK